MQQFILQEHLDIIISESGGEIEEITGECEAHISCRFGNRKYEKNNPGVQALFAHDNYYVLCSHLCCRGNLDIMCSEATRWKNSCCSDAMNLLLPCCICTRKILVKNRDLYID